jgi:hypothetical protein
MFDEQIFAVAYTTFIELWMELALQAFARSLRGCVALLLALSGFALARPVVASDHQDTLYLATDRPGADLTDVFVFPAADPNKVVLAMDVHPLIPTGMGMSASFDPGVMYQFHIAHGKYNFEQDQVIQFKATGVGTSQTITMYGPGTPGTTGTYSHWITPFGSAVYNRATPIGHGVMLYAGPRQDPFYFDLTQFFKIVPDRNFKNQPNPPAATASCFRKPGQDFLAPFNVLAVVAEIPRTMLADAHGNLGIIHVWATTSIDRDSSGSYAQIERLARPAVKEATEPFQLHDATNRSTPTNDPNLARSVYSFVHGTAHRSNATARALVKVLIPDELEANLAEGGPARYLAVETNGKSGLPTGVVRIVPVSGILGLKKALDNPLRQFGGRDPSSPVIDLSLGAIFGSLPSKLGLAPDDHRETDCLTSDNVQPPSRGVMKTFPYLGRAM